MKASELEIGKKYYTNSYTGIIVVTLLEIIDEETALVKTRRASHSKNPSNGYGKQKILQRMLAEHGNLQKDEAEESNCAGKQLASH